jgi:hypothetical protein
MKGGNRQTEERQEGEKTKKKRKGRREGSYKERSVFFSQLII